MADGWTYSQWVVGNSRMRAVDSDWPAVGTRILHSIGVWPAVIDETEVLSCTPQQELVLWARLVPLGPARITLRLPDRVQLAGIWPRNKECTWRLANLAEQRDPDEFG